MKISVDQVYTAVACNRTPEIADWNREGLLCFGAANAVIIYDTVKKCKDPLIVLSQHRLRVNTVKWLHKYDGTSTELLSGSADKTAAIWSYTGGAWKVTHHLTGHTDGVTCIHGTYLNNTDLMVCTGSIDSTVRIWERRNDTLTHKHTINLNYGLCLTLNLHILPAVNKPILLCGLDDNKIHVYAGEEFHKVHALTGHEDWVRGLDVVDVENSAVLVASASQDTYIRLWRIQLHVNHDSSDGIKVEQKVFPAYNYEWSVKLEAVLAGHEAWVYGVQWHPYRYENGKKHIVHCLLSSSLDKTLIVWEPDGSINQEEGQGVWVEKVRVGEVGGNGLGFYGSRFGPDGASFMGHGYNGSLHIWKLDCATNKWQPSVVCGGHFNSVEDVRWEPARGRYIISVSADQTTRVHAPWKQHNGCGSEWHEIARPQVHGYDMMSVAPVNGVMFASAAEEKVIRVFRAPHNFLQNFQNITGEVLAEGENGVEGALVPSLGLSNKAVFMGDDNRTDVEDDNDGYFVSVNLTEPPTEETLMQNTLWPESQKLYGHGYEVFAIDASPDGELLASACRATLAEHAAVIVWETKTWKQIQKLVSHQLTVTQLAFSPDSQQLVSVSRDRRWTLYQRAQGSNHFDIAASTDKTNGVHTRIIWCCAWAHDGTVFGTGSREGKVCIWSKTETRTETSLNYYALLGEPLQVSNASVTALSFAPLRLPEGSRVIATGFESGLIRMYRFTIRGDWDLLRELDNSAAHHLSVKRLTFKPSVNELEDGSTETMLASCGADHLVRIYSVVVTCN